MRVREAAASQTWTQATTTPARFLLALLGVGLLAAGALYAILGAWGVDRGSVGSWKLALLGLLGAGIGAILLLRAVRPRRPSSP
jgi:uncharacterized membrane protein HdeD (DUF308 family)